MDEDKRVEQSDAGEQLLSGIPLSETEYIMRPLEADRWHLAEQRTSDLINCIQPCKLSEDFRSAVASYLERIIIKCVPCQVFTFGSVPLKTYLPDGDIDLTTFCDNETTNETSISLILDALQNEAKDDNSEFRVKEVQYIHAEVKIIKCLVERTVVDISFNQLGGLSTLCFLEEVDNLISDNHLYKRSIILIKAWCYYESRVLGAYHGLISTYALEVLVLYIFHIFNSSFSGPLEVLHRFLEFFSKFDWNVFCISLWGPVPIASLPNLTANPPRNDGEELLLSKPFLDACSSLYAVHSNNEENQSQPFTPKYLNVVDPLRVNNNLGRSVSKGNFFRIINAFKHGASRMRRILDCPTADVPLEVNQFFLNTWNMNANSKRSDTYSRRKNLVSSHSESNGNSRNEPDDKSTEEVTKEETRNIIHDDAITCQTSSNRSIISKRGSASLNPLPDSGRRRGTKHCEELSCSKQDEKAVKKRRAKKKKKECSAVEDANKSEASPQRNADSFLYQIGPPLPFIAWYNFPANRSSPSADTLDSDFASHWQNLQFGRICQLCWPLHIVSHPPGCCLHHLGCDGESGNGNNVNVVKYRNEAGSSQMHPHGRQLLLLCPSNQPHFALQTQFRRSPTRRSSPAGRR